MTRCGKILLLALIGLSPLQALAQIPGGGVGQSGSVTANDCAAWLGNGLIKDAGAPCGSGGGSPGGSPGQLQWNSAGSFGGISGWTTDGTNALTGGASSTLTVGGAALGSHSTAINGDVLINPTNSAGAAGLTINDNTASVPSLNIHPGGILLNGADNAISAFYAYAYGTDIAGQGSFRSIFEGYSANGAGASPTATNTNDELVRFAGRGYGTSFTSTVGAMSIIAAQNFTVTNQGTFTAFRSTPLNNIGGGIAQWPPVVGSFAPSGALLVGGQAVQATFTGSISGTALTVNSGAGIAVGQLLIGSGVSPGTVINSGSGTSWVVNKSQTVGSESMSTGVPWALQTANDTGAGTINVQISATIGAGSALTSTGPGGTLTALAYTSAGSGVPTALGNTAGGAGGFALYSSTLAPAQVVVKIPVDFSLANNDNPISLVLPTGFSRYRINSILISGASASLTAATIGVFTGTGGSGTAIVTTGTAVTVSTASDNTSGNGQSLTLATCLAGTITCNFPTIYFRTQNTATGTATVTLLLIVES